MYYSLKESLREWKREVDAEAARLIETGVPPFVAMERAGEIVRERRRPKAASSGGDSSNG